MVLHAERLCPLLCVSEESQGGDHDSAPWKSLEVAVFSAPAQLQFFEQRGAPAMSIIISSEDVEHNDRDENDRGKNLKRILFHRITMNIPRIILAN